MSSKKKTKKGKRTGSPDSKKKERLLREQREKEEEERKLLEEEEKRKAKRAAIKLLREQARRDQLLKSSCKWIKKLEMFVETLNWAKRQELEWDKYINCGNLPVAHDIPMMNTYLFMLAQKKILWQVDYCFEMSPQLLQIIETIDDYICNPLGASYNRINNWHELRQGYRNIIDQGINMMSYSLVKNINKNLTPIDLWTFQFRKSCEDFFLGIWVFGEYPKLTGYPEHDFSEVGVKLVIPKPFHNQAGVLRLVKLNYNHLNDRCVTWSCPQLPVEYNTDLYEASYEWFLERIRLTQDFTFKAVDVGLDNWEDGTFFKKIISNGYIPPVSKKKLSIYDIRDLKRALNMSTPKGEDDNEIEYNLRTIDINEYTQSMAVEVPIGKIIDILNEDRDVDLTVKCPQSQRAIRTIDELIEEFVIPKTDKGQVVTEKPKIDHEEEKARVNQILEDMERLYTEQIVWKRLETEVDSNEINLRKFSVIGPLYWIELYNLPEQEILLHDKSKLTTIRGAKELERCDFDIKYVAPSIVEEKQQDEETKDKKKAEDIISQMMRITLNLEESCLWFEPPQLVQWDKVKRCWTDEYIVDAKFNEEKQSFTFLSGRLGIFGLCVPRFPNLPYQTWDLRPEPGTDDSILFNLTASTVILDFKINKDQVSIAQIQNAPSSVMDSLVNKYFDLPILIKKMRRLGLDVFPEYDSFKYVEGSTYKDIILENHTYSCLAVFCLAYNFTWSRWNSFSGRNRIVFQLREATGKSTVPNYDMFAASTDQAVMVDCTEVSPAFNEKGITGMDYYPDLYSALCFHSSPTAKQRIEAVHPSLVQNVANVLKATRVFTFS